MIFISHFASSYRLELQTVYNLPSLTGMVLIIVSMAHLMLSF